MMKTVVYQGENFLGDVEIYLENNKNNYNWNKNEIDILLTKGINISHYSQASERCPPFSVLHTITAQSSSSSNGLRFKMMESSNNNNTKLLYFQQQNSPLLSLHSTCLRDNKTAVIPFGNQEIHLVAMRSRRIDDATPCFWGFSVMPGLYVSCLGMLNLRCLGIVFDLDETLIVANTLRSFEDRIEALQRKISMETDPQRMAGMMGEVKRYQEDKAILKQYAETDQVVENGKVHKIQAEVIPALSDNHQTIVRPLVRLQDKNIVLTRINPQIRDTSVLVRLRPAWEDLRSYLTARGRKRFEVYVCTMAERDYALEMWRLLDPDSNLICARELLERIVCVKSGSKKSLFNVFHGGVCHPKMALVIDDRLKVWDEKDQHRVHVVPAFSPYYNPQAEANHTIPVLRVARNVACNVRGGFFKEYDEGFLQRISEVSFEDDPRDVLSPPDVSNFLVSEDDGSGCNENKESLRFDGMADAEFERRLKQGALSSSSASSLPCATLGTISFESRLTVATSPITIPQPALQASILPFHTNLFPQEVPATRSMCNIGPQDVGLHSSPAPEEGEVPESEVDPDTRRRLLILQHGQDMRENLFGEPSFQVGPAVQAPVQVTGPVPGPVPASVSAPVAGQVPGLVPHVQSRGSWFPVEDHMNPGPMTRLAPKEFPMAPDFVPVEKHRPPPFPRKVENSVWSDRTFSEKQRLLREAPRGDDRLRPNYSLPSHQSLQGNGISFNRSASSNNDSEVEPERGSSFSESPSVALHEIAMRCGAKVKFKSGLVATAELKFSMETYFAGEKIGDGTGTTRREAMHRSAEAALMNLAGRYLSHMKSETGTHSPQNDTNRGQTPSDMGFVCDANSHVDLAIRKEETVPSSEVTKLDDYGSRNSIGSASVLKDLCLQEDPGIDFKDQSLTSTNPVHRDEIHAEVEINGQVLGKGTGLTWDEAEQQAAEMAFASLKSMLGQITKYPVIGMKNGREDARTPPPYLYLPKFFIPTTYGRSLKRMTSKCFKVEYPQVVEHMPSSRYPRNASPSFTLDARNFGDPDFIPLIAKWLDA